MVKRKILIFLFLVFLALPVVSALEGSYEF